MVSELKVRIAACLMWFEILMTADVYFGQYIDCLKPNFAIDAPIKREKPLVH